MSEEELNLLKRKAAILDWLMTPEQARPDRPARIDKQINRNSMTSLLVFRVWGTPDEAIAAIERELEAAR